MGVAWACRIGVGIPCALTAAERLDASSLDAELRACALAATEGFLTPDAGLVTPAAALCRGKRIYECSVDAHKLLYCVW